MEVTEELETIYYTREAKAILGVLDSSGQEVPLVELLEQAGVDLIIAPTVIRRLLGEGKIVYQIRDGIQHFSINNKKTKK